MRKANCLNRFCIGFDDISSRNLIVPRLSVFVNGYPDVTQSEWYCRKERENCSYYYLFDAYLHTLYGNNSNPEDVIAGSGTPVALKPYHICPKDYCTQHPVAEPRINCPTQRGYCQQYGIYKFVRNSQNCSIQKVSCKTSPEAAIILSIIFDVFGIGYRFRLFYIEPFYFSDSGLK